MLLSELSYSEWQWQEEILQIILLMYPKYLHAFREVPVKNRRVDFLLVDAIGHIDVVEIKKPFDKSIVAKQTYRDNHIPLRELSGTIMQIEKYIFHGLKMAKNGSLSTTKISCQMDFQ